MAELQDASVRIQAIDPRHSFIVQAPAGSGKTEILTQRILKLLAVVKRPEAILAITFTRKAAAEMKARVLSALNAAQQPCPENPLEQHRWQLARDVLARDQDQQWHLLDNPHRLRITTIDGLCGQLASTLLHPTEVIQGQSLLSVSDLPSQLYQDSLLHMLADIEGDAPWQHALQAWLQHRDHRVEEIIKLLSNMLARREQWLPVLMLVNDSEALPQKIERVLKRRIDSHLKALTEALPSEARTHLQTLLAFAARNLEYPENEWRLEATHSHLNAWQFLAKIMLTAKLTWRSKVTVKQGFPAASSASNAIEKKEYQSYKEAIQAILNSWQGDDALELLLAECLMLPPPTLSSAQATLLKHLQALLPAAVAYLNMTMQSQSQTDFTQIALNAIEALGYQDSASQLALAYDQRLEHVLIDEFQDTSQLQYRLLLALTQGWQADDARTLFLVGDPMQSIYRFRQADVNLFWQAKQQGIGNKALKFLALTSNFRSAPDVIKWVNAHFKTVFPAIDDPDKGAVSFASAYPQRHDLTGQVHWQFAVDAESEASQLSATIQQYLHADASQTIAVLVRSRQHAAILLQQLTAQDIAVNVSELQTLADAPLGQDLFSLTCALMHLGDRLSWFALLRGPWCGLNLDDLFWLARASEQCSVWQVLTQALPEQLSESGKQRIQTLLSILSPIMSLAEQGLFKQVSGAWHYLNQLAPISVKIEQQASQFFALLCNYLEGGGVFDRTQFWQLLQTVRVNQVSPNARVELMTMHKSKGLEFDVVILPQLQRATRGDNNSMLLWQSGLDENNQLEVILAPLQGKTDQKDPVYAYLQRNEQERADEEIKRLFYVACTRAKRHLVLSASVSKKETGEWQKPAKGALLSLVWPAAEGILETSGIDVSQATTSIKKPSLQPKGLCQLNIALPEQPSVDSSDVINMPTPPEPQFDYERWAGLMMHVWLARVAKEGLSAWSEAKIKSEALWWQQVARSVGAVTSVTVALINQVSTWACAVLSDKTAAWILADHQQAQSEWVLWECIANKKPRQHIIDRTFIDDKGVRWIIDYKTTLPKSGESEGDFEYRLQQEYRPQLGRYRWLLQQREPQREIQTCLYVVPLKRIIEL